MGGMHGLAGLLAWACWLDTRAFERFIFYLLAEACEHRRLAALS
jgi:hypothetical protein